MSSKKGLKALILGLDGATFDVMDPLLRQGQLPNFRKLMDEGTWGKLRSTIPPVSAPAWGAFMTGKNPGKLGIYDFYTYDPMRYSFLEPSLITSAPLVGRTFWDILGKLGLRVGVITVQVTYPPWAINGFMISGYPCPDSKRNYTYPAELADSLTEPYNWSADVLRTATLEQMAQEGYQMMARRTSLALRLLEERPCDLLCLVLGATDMAQHYFWKYSAPASTDGVTDKGRFSDVIPKMYRTADECLGRLLQVTTEDTLILVMSDHGGAPAPTKEVHINCLLKSLELLRLDPRKRLTSSVQGKVVRFMKRAIRRRAKVRALLPQAVRHGVRKVSFNVASIDWASTKAYRFPMTPPADGLVINVVGRQPQGVVKPGQEYERLRRDIVDQLLQLRDEETGKAIVERVYRREELYNGEHMAKAPDLVVLFAEGYMGGKGLDAPLITPHSVDKVNGQHGLDGILVARGKGIKRSYHQQGAHILDLAPTILYALAAPIPSDVDGKVLESIFEKSFLRGQAIRYAEPLAASGRPKKALTPEEEETMKEKLRSLGYLS